MLYLIATPIGNLKDITFRAIETLKDCDYILCEDTRHSKILLDEYDIEKPLKSFHQFNEKQLEDKVVADLQSGKEICLISDAGTPGICDPGERLIQRCYVENIPFTSLPGPCAFAVALSVTPFSKERVQFLGFLSKKEGERKRILAAALSSPFTTIFYEAPHRLLQLLAALPPQRKVCVMREISKKFEQRHLDSAASLLHYFEQNSPKGELVVVVEGSPLDYSELSAQEHVKHLEKEYQITKADAIKIAAELRKVPKREIYRVCHNN